MPRTLAVTGFSTSPGSTLEVSIQGATLRVETKGGGKQHAFSGSISTDSDGPIFAFTGDVTDTAGKAHIEGAVEAYKGRLILSFVKTQPGIAETTYVLYSIPGNPSKFQGEYRAVPFGRGEAYVELTEPGTVTTA